MSNLRGIDRNLMESQQQRQTLQARIVFYGFHLDVHATSSCLRDYGTTRRHIRKKNKTDLI